MGLTEHNLLSGMKFHEMSNETAEKIVQDEWTTNRRRGEGGATGRDLLSSGIARPNLDPELFGIIRNYSELSGIIRNRPDVGGKVLLDADFKHFDGRC